MCGLISVLTKNQNGFSVKDMKIFQQMLFVDTLRGEDSTGVFGVNRHGSISVVKSAMAAPDFIRTKSYDDWDTDMFREGSILVGHNRSATKGAIDDSNAHPFSEGNITLVHNGTLNWHKSFSDKEVDSHAICEFIAEKGYKEALKTIEGAFALIWFDQEQNKLFISRNSKRPLGMIYSKDRSSLYIASELAMIPWILSRNGVEHEGKYNVFEEDKNDKGFVYSFDLGELTFKKECVDFYTPKVWVGGTGKEGAYNYKHGFYGHPGYEGYEEEEEEKETEVEKPSVPDKKEEKPGVVLPFGHGSVVGAGKQLPQIVPENEPEANILNADWWNKQRSFVIFKVSDFKESVSTQGFWHVTGTFRGLEVVCKIKDDVLEDFLCFENLIGEVIRIFVKNDKIEYLSLGNVQPFLESYSKNTQLVTAADWMTNKDHLFCDECGMEIMMREIPNTIIRFDSNSHKVRRVVCEGCTKKLGNKGKVSYKQQKQMQRVCH